MRQILILLALFTIGTVAVPAQAAEATERPSLLEDFFRTESVYPQNRGETQITLGTSYSQRDDDESFDLGAGLEFGLTDQLQLEVEWTAYEHFDASVGNNSHGSGDVAVGGKYTFSPCPRSGIQTALGFDVTLPTGSDDVGGHAYIYEPYLVLSRNLGDDANLHASFSYGIVDGTSELAGDDAFDEFEANLGSVYRVAPDWRLTLEASVESNEFDTGSETAIYLTPGFLWKGIEDVEAGLAVAGGLTGDSDDWQLLGMVSFEF